MCPLRFILIFFSTMLAAYIAWTTMTSSPEIDFTTQDRENKASSNKDHFNFIKMIQNGFWVFVDMASGGYLWRNLKSRNDGVREVNGEVTCRIQIILQTKFSVHFPKPSVSFSRLFSPFYANYYSTQSRTGLKFANSNSSTVYALHL
ncbi:hypothetical protein GmHk_16G045683 [Glycine max]|nr:hypothetical protein GmHk_16G045683 [Glycine max]